MRINAEGMAILKKYEGCKLRAYKAVATEKYWTIGYGHFGKDVSPNMTITEQQAEEYLKKDIALFEQGIERAYKGVNLTDNQFSALVVMAYNCGVNATTQTLYKLIKTGNKEDIAKWWSTHYVTSGGVKLNGLVKRRIAEAELFTR